MFALRPLPDPPPAIEGVTLGHSHLPLIFGGEPFTGPSCVRPSVAQVNERHGPIGLLRRWATADPVVQEAMGHLWYVAGRSQETPELFVADRQLVDCQTVDVQCARAGPLLFLVWKILVQVISAHVGPALAQLEH